MYGETDVVRKHAGRLRDQGEDIRALAERLVSHAESLHWSGRAADAMRERVRERAVRLREAAARHDTAADALDVHGREVDGVKDAIADAQRRVARTGSTEAELPPAGHKDWLELGVPLSERR